MDKKRLKGILVWVTAGGRTGATSFVASGFQRTQHQKRRGRLGPFRFPGEDASMGKRPSYENLEEIVRQLEKESQERKRVEAALRKSEAAVKDHVRNLEEVKMALKVLLKRREEDKAELEEKVLSNVKGLILPYVDALRNTRLDPKQQTYLGIIESHLNRIVSPFSAKLSSKYWGLTPREIQVAALIKEGKTSKEIAELSNVSTRAIEFHRDNIRAKLGLKNKKANLRSSLLSLP